MKTKIYPIPPAIANRKAFLKIKKKASLHAIQKQLLVIAHWIYAFLLMNLIILSKQARQQWHIFNPYLTKSLYLSAPVSLNYFSTYIIISLANYTTAKIKDPNAKVPKW